MSQTPPQKKRLLPALLAVTALLVVGGAVGLMNKGADIKQRFEAANEGVENEVRFNNPRGSGGDDASASEVKAVEAPAKPAPTRPATKAAAESAETQSKGGAVVYDGSGAFGVSSSGRGGGEVDDRGFGSSSLGVRQDLEVIQMARTNRVKKKPMTKGGDGEVMTRFNDIAAKPSIDRLSEGSPRHVALLGDDNARQQRRGPSLKPRRPERAELPAELFMPPPVEALPKQKERTTPVRAPRAFEASEEVAAGDEFTDHGVNPMTLTSEDALSTFSVDVDTGAYALARRQINAGYRPTPASVRVEEYVNYFAYNYPAPSEGAFSVSMEVAPSPFDAAPRRYMMRVGVQGKQLDQRARKPVHLTFLVDVSGSMDSLDKLPLAKQSLKILTNNLREGDTVALVTYASGSRVVLPATDASYKGKILAAIDMLYADGSTAMGDGLAQAYRQADATHKKGDVSRVIVLSDGDANVGARSTLHEQIMMRAQRGITLSTIGFGAGNYKDNLMEQLANKGDGNYYYIDSPREAIKVFGEQMSGTLEVIAKDVKIQVEFDPEKVESYRLIGYENRDIADKDFRNDKVDAGEIGAGHTITAFYELVLKAEPGAGFATVRVRHKEPEGDVASEQAFAVALTDLRMKLAHASLDFQFGASVVAFAELLRGSPYASKLSFGLVEELATAASSANQTERQEFISLVQKVRKLTGQ
jgi:Ca-activated chloride channel homolog